VRDFQGFVEFRVIFSAALFFLLIDNK